MKRASKLLWLAVTLGCVAGCASPQEDATASLSGTLKKIKDSGKVVLGVRESSPPMVYNAGDNQYVGYHIEICQRIAAALKAKLALPSLLVEYRSVTFQTRISSLEDGSVDLDCGSTTNTLARQKQVAFSLTTFVTEVRMAVKADSGIESIAHLAGRRVVTTAGTMTIAALRQHHLAGGLQIAERSGKTHPDSFRMIEAGDADAFVLDDNLLAGLIAGGARPADYRIVGEPVSIEPIALMMRKDDPAFKQAVDARLISLMATGEMQALYDKWFMKPIPPRQVSVNLPMSATLRKLMAAPNDQPMESYARR